MERKRKFQSPEAPGSGGKATSALFSLRHVQGYPSTTPLQYLPLHPIQIASSFLYNPDASISRVHSVNSHRIPKIFDEVRRWHLALHDRIDIPNNTTALDINKPHYYDSLSSTVYPAGAKINTTKEEALG